MTAAAAASFLRRRWVLALLGSLAVTLFWFHNLAWNLDNSVLYGPNDESYSIRFYWGAAHAHLNPFTFGRDTLNGWPEGLGNPTAVQWANALIPVVIWGLHYTVGLVAAENVFLLGGFVLSGFALFVLLDRFGFHPAASAYCAYAATFTPWTFERAGAGHHGFMQLWVFVLLLGALLLLRERRSLFAAVLAGGALTLTFYDSPYYGLLAVVLFAVFVIVDFVQQPTWGDRLWSFTLLDVSVVAAVVAYLPTFIAWHGNRGAVAAGVSNPVQEVQNGGASIASYAMPGTRNPFLGDITRHFYPRADFVWSENTLYIGWSLLILALVGVWLVIRRYPFTRRTSLLRYFLVCITVTLPVAFVWSLKRETSVLGATVPMPSYFVSELTTFWRVYARFGVLVILACAILAALTIHVVLAHRRWWSVPLVVLAFGALVLEHAIKPPPVYKLSPPAPWVRWLGEQPFGSVANYPLPTDKPQALVLLAESYFDQIHDKQPQFMLFGSGYGDTREDAIRILARYVTDPLTPGILRAEQVKYVLLHDDVYRSQGEQPPPIPAGMHLVARIPGHVRALELDEDVRPADLPSVLRDNAVSIALVQGLPVPSLETPGADVASDGSRTFTGSIPFELKWQGQNPLAVVQFLIHARSPSGATTLKLYNAAGDVVGQAGVATGDTQIVLGPVGVDSGSYRTSFVVRSDSAAPVKLTSVQIQPVANVTKSILDVGKS